MPPALHQGRLTHTEVRHAIVEYAAAHLDDSTFDVLRAALTENGQTAEEYLTRMEQLGTYGGDPEIAVAAILYNVRIEVYAADARDPSHPYIVHEPAHGAVRTIRLWWIRNGPHYQLLVPIHGSSTYSLMRGIEAAARSL